MAGGRLASIATGTRYRTLKSTSRPAPKFQSTEHLAHPD
jgi:hypothetical protein